MIVGNPLAPITAPAAKTPPMRAPATPGEHASAPAM